MKPNLKIVTKVDSLSTSVLCKEIVKEYKQNLRPSGPVVNQHASDDPSPRLEVDEVLSKSFKDIGK